MFHALVEPSANGDAAVYLVVKSRPDRASLGAYSYYNRLIAQVWMPSYRAGEQ